MRLPWLRRACTHPDVALTPSEDATTALVACTGCSWRVVAPLPPTARATPLPATAVMVDAHAFQELRLAAQVEAVFTEWPRP